jgi:hypothetical protein
LRDQSVYVEALKIKERTMKPKDKRGRFIRDTLINRIKYILVIIKSKLEELIK